MFVIVDILNQSELFKYHFGNNITRNRCVF